MNTEEERTVEEEASGEERSFEYSLRPNTLEDYIGQEQIKENLRIFMSAARQRNENIEHVLFYGPPGLGKTTLAHIVANEMGGKLRVTAGPSIEKSGDLAAILSNLEEGDFLFIDEIHRLHTVLEEVLYPAMEDYKLDLVVGKGPAARTLKIELPPFTVIGATTKYNMLSAPLRDRFGVTFRLEYYDTTDMEKIIDRSAKILQIQIDRSAIKLIAERSRNTPRIANRILKRVRDVATVKGDGFITEALTRDTLRMLDIDEKGLDKLDRRVLEALIHQYSGGPVGVTTLAATVSEDPSTVEDVYEPFLLKLGFLIRTPRGRVATRAAYEHLGVEIPKDITEKLL